MTKKQFNFGESPVAETDKSIRTSETTKTKNNETRTEMGIMLKVPIEDYKELALIKLNTGETLGNLVRKAIHEFVTKMGK